MANHIQLLHYGVAFLAVDCQRVFTHAACQGSVDTERAANQIAEVLPSLLKKDAPLFTLFSNAKHVKDAGLLLPVIKGTPIGKKHESGFTGSDLDGRLHRAGAKTLIVFGFHFTTCVLNTALAGVNNGYKVIVPADLCGEGDRGRHLSLSALHDRKAQAYERMERAGVFLTTSNLILH